MNTLYPTQVQAELFDALGIEIPRLGDLAAISKAMAEAANTDPGEDLAAAITAGKVTPKNAADKLLDAAGRQVAADAAQEIYTRALHAISTATAEAVRAEGDSIIAALAGRFADAAADLVATVGVDLPRDPKRVLKDPHLADVHARRIEADRKLTEIARTRTSLAMRFKFGPSTPTASWWIADAPHLDALTRAERIGRTWHALLEAGFELKLTTPTEAAEIEARAAEAARLAAQPSPEEMERRRKLSEAWHATIPKGPDERAAMRELSR